MAVLEEEKRKEEPTHIKGSIIPMITPLVEVGGHFEIDTKSTANLTNYLIKGGCNGIFVLGTAGEFRGLDLESKLDVVKSSVIAAEKRVPILVGVSSARIEESAKISRVSERLGADALVLCPMFGEGDLQSKLDAVFQASTLPVILYNNPEIHGNTKLPLPFIEESIKSPRVIGIKDTSRDAEYFAQLLKLREDAMRKMNLGILQGSTGYLLSSLQQGADGFICVMGNADPKLLADLYISFQGGNIQKAEEIMDRIMEMRKTLSTITGIKSELVKKGIISSNRILGK